MTIWKVSKHYFGNDDCPTYIVSPYDFHGYMKYCFWRNGLKNVYLFKRRADNKVNSLNRAIQRRRKSVKTIKECDNNEH